MTLISTLDSAIVSLKVNNRWVLMAEKFRKFANAAAAMAVSFSRPNYFESGKKGNNNKNIFSIEFGML